MEAIQFCAPALMRTDKFILTKEAGSLHRMKLEFKTRYNLMIYTMHTQQSHRTEKQFFEKPSNNFFSFEKKNYKFQLG